MGIGGGNVVGVNAIKIAEPKMLESEGDEQLVPADGLGAFDEDRTVTFRRARKYSQRAVECKGEAGRRGSNGQGSQLRTDGRVQGSEAGFEIAVEMRAVKWVRQSQTAGTINLRNLAD